MNDMRFRKILIVLGWGVILVSITSLVSHIFSAISLDKLLREASRELSSPLWVKFANNILGMVYYWAIAALCFNAAHKIAPLWKNNSPDVFD